MRACKKCKKPLDEYLHKSRMFCPPPSQIERSKGIRDTKCKQKYNNALKAKIRKEMNQLIMIHWSNYKILNKLKESGVTYITTKELLQLGFKLHFTIFIHKDKNVFTYWNYNLKLIENDKYTLHANS